MFFNYSETSTKTNTVYWYTDFSPKQTLFTGTLTPDQNKHCLLVHWLLTKTNTVYWYNDSSPKQTLFTGTL